MPKKMLEDASPVKFPFSHPDKVFYPKDDITKLELAEYYNLVHEWMLPHVVKRPLTLVRCPQGIQQCFFQKHINDLNSDNLFAINIKEKNTTAPYIYIKNKNGLFALVQFAALEIHAWGCHIDKIEKPDMITFDIDPSPEMEWKKVIETAFFIKDNLQKIRIKSFVKTTGGKGLHVVVPVQRQYSWEEIEMFAHTFVDYLVSLKPDLYTSNMSKAKRKGKIFLDYLRNQRGATSIMPYSTRAHAHAPVATPLSWDELTVKIKSDSFNIHNLPARLNKLKKDPWADFFVIKQRLTLPED